MSNQDKDPHFRIDAMPFRDKLIMVQVITAGGTNFHYLTPKQAYQTAQRLLRSLKNLPAQAFEKD